MKYDAFISYRHAELDMEIAKKVHAGLESFKVPKAVTKRAKKTRIRRVFRDQEELPIGSDLGDNIATALYQSDYLIVICSPRTMGSEWVMKEIDTFISMHGRSQILAVLIEGEPYQSFPPQLMIDDYGRPVEPLAADVRGATAKERNEKLKTELIRLAAPILGVNYDDLRQRHREQKIRKTFGTVAAIAGGVAVAAAGFAVYSTIVARQMKQLAEEKTQLADEKTELAEEKEALASSMVALNFELEQSLQGQLRNQSSFLAATAENMFEAGNREDAVLIALAALPSAPDYNNRPYIAEAEFALSQFLYAYDNGDSLEFDRTLDHEMNVSRIEHSKGSSYIITQDSVGAIYIWNAYTGERIYKLNGEIDNVGTKIIPEAIAISDDTFYVVTQSELRIYDFSGNLKNTVDLGAEASAAKIYPESGLAFCRVNKQLLIVDLKAGMIVSSYASGGNFDFGSIMDFNEDTGIFAISHYDFSGGAGVSIVDCRNGFAEVVYETTGCEIMAIDVADDNQVSVVIITNNYLLESKFDYTLVSLNAEDGAVLWSASGSERLDNSISADIDVKNRCYTDDYGEDCRETCLAIDNTIITYDGTTGEKKSDVGVSGTVSAFVPFASSNLGYVAQTNGNIDLVNITDGVIYPTYVITTNKTIADLYIGGGMLAFRSYSDKEVTLMTYHPASDLETIATGVEGSGAVLSLGEDYFVTYGSYDCKEYNFYSVGGTFLKSFEVDCSDYRSYTGFSSDNYFIFNDRDGKCHWYNPYSDESYECYIFDDQSSYVYNAYYTANKKYVVYTDNRQYSLIDLEQRKVIYSDKASHNIGSIAVSEDGTTLYLVHVEDTFVSIDVATGSVTQYPELGITVANDSGKKIVVSADNRYVAVYCKDGNIRTADVIDRKITAEFPVYGMSKVYLSLITDTAMLLVHCNDEYINIVEADTGYTFSQIAVKIDGIKSITYDSELDYIAVTDSYGVTLLTTSDFEPVAYAESAFGYVTQTHTFLMRVRNDVYTTKYKDFKALIEEANRQFPGAELTPEEKDKYNIY